MSFSVPVYQGETSLHVTMTDKINFAYPSMQTTPEVAALVAILFFSPVLAPVAVYGAERLYNWYKYS